jgi:hypothetical protein
MSRMQPKLILVLVASIALFGCKPEPTGKPPPSLAVIPCELREEFKSEVNIVLLDRTTSLSQQDGERWARGLDTLLRLHEVAGRIELLDLVAVGKLAPPPITVCYPASLKKPVRTQEPSDVVHQLSKFLGEWRFGTPKIEEPTDELVDEINDARKKQRDFVVAVPATRSVAETKTTDIERPVREAISKRCQLAQVCRLLMFTDLMDTDIQRKLSSLDVTGSSELGSAYANSMVDASRHWSPEVSIQVVVWNFGRDERGANAAAPDEAQQKLEAFWTSYFSSICKRAAPDSGVWISLEGPANLPDACS